MHDSTSVQVCHAVSLMPLLFFGYMLRLACLMRQESGWINGGSLLRASWEGRGRGWISYNCSVSLYRTERDPAPWNLISESAGRGKGRADENWRHHQGRQDSLE